MSLFDLLIIYLACGAPVSVNYYFQNKTLYDKNIVARKTFLVFVGWLPFVLKSAVTILNSIFQNYKNSGSSVDFEKSATLVKKEFEKNVFKGGCDLSIFEFRETVERYFELTHALQNVNQKPTPAEENLFHIGNAKKNDLSAICLHRRNRSRLVRHQSEARSDFLQLLEKLFVFHSDKKNFGAVAIEFATLLNDPEALNAINDLLLENAVLKKDAAAKNSGRILWNKEQLRPMPVGQTSFHLTSATATTALSSKD